MLQIRFWQIEAKNIIILIVHYYYLFMSLNLFLTKIIKNNNAHNYITDRIFNSFFGTD